MIFGQKFSTGGKIFTTLIMLFMFSSLVYAKKVTFAFTGTTLKEDLKTYLLWQKYLEKNSHFDIGIKFARTYAEVISSIKDEKTDIAYVCSSTYMILRDKKNARLLAIPIINGKDKYYSYVIALKKSKYKSLLDFKGKIYAFTDPGSNSGAIAPTYFLLKKGYKVNTFFRNLVYTYDHGESIKAVIDGFVDGASVDSLVYAQYIKKHPSAAKKLRIVQKLGPFTISPIVIRYNINKKEFKKLQDLFLNMNKTKIGKEILNHLNIERFIKPSNQEYTKIYQMQKYIKEHK